MDYHINPATGVWDDNYWSSTGRYLAGEGGGGGGGASAGPSPEEIVNQIMQTQNAKIEEESKWLSQYTADNPFAFDEALAKESASAEYTPYYSELMEDYLKGVDLQKTTIQDTRKLQGELNRLDVGEKTRSYQRAVGQAEEGFAGQGMFFSGIKKRALGQGEVEQKMGMERQATSYGAQETGLQRRETALGMEQTETGSDCWWDRNQTGRSNDSILCAVHSIIQTGISDWEFKHRGLFAREFSPV
jgi:hypothetical protein